MTDSDKDLTQRLRQYLNSKYEVTVCYNGLRDEAANRIDELVESNKELTLQLLATHGQAADALDKAVVAEAKLTKAVEALRETTQMLSQCTFTIIRIKGQYFERHEVVDKANAVLAELEGK
jgi:predicted transcriptional regulator